MKETFEDILTSTLEELEKNPDMNIEDLMNSQTSKYNVSEEAQESLAETFACLDKFAEKSESLDEARKAGLTRGQWMVSEIEQMTKDCCQDEKDAVATAIVTSIEQHTDKEMEEANNENE